MDAISTDHLDRALADSSGHLAIGEACDGPFCILCVVDNRKHNRLAFRLLHRSPTQDDVRDFLKALKGRLDGRGLGVRGNTTDGSSLCPKVLKELWPGVRHRPCRFHVVMEIDKAILHALAALRKEMAATIPEPGRGPPSKEQAPLAREARRRKQRAADLFENRHLFVRRQLAEARRRELARLTRGQAGLRRLREVMDEVCRLFDRRCKTSAALGKLARPRHRVRRFTSLGDALKKLDSPNLEKAPESLDDKLLGSTSNAVERADRRFRKAQGSIRSARTKGHIEQRLALDMHREQRAPERRQAMETLHDARSEREPGHP